MEKGREYLKKRNNGIGSVGKLILKINKYFRPVMVKRFIIVLFSLILFTSNLFSLNHSFSIDFNLLYNFKDEIFSLYNATVDNFLTMGIKIGYESENFTFIASINAANDEIYNDQFSEGYYSGFYFNFGEALINYRISNSLISFGKCNLGGIVYSPYTLFISSMKYPRNVLEYRYEDDKFIYITRWIELNNLESALANSEKYRSANYKIYAIKLENFRFGYEEINVYVGKNFDFEYFANPVPGFFIQYVNHNGRPFSEGLGETNFLMGFFADYTEKDKYLYLELLIDDINMNRFLYPGSFQNPDKIAWSFGGSFDSNIGRLSIYNAGATKYTFQPSSESGNNVYYGYTYFPYLTYQKNSKTMIFPPELLYAGYKYGENNIAILFEYVPKYFLGMEPDSITKLAKLSVEYVILGERSPVNPWNEASTFPEGTHLLDDSVLEHRLLTSFYLNYPINDLKHKYFSGIELTLNVLLQATIGYIWNKSELIEVSSDNSKKPLLRPVEGNNTPYFSLFFGTNLKISF
ncbi:MAG: hypothetical protein ACK4R7_02280 [Fervidobacterium sp.]